MFHHSGAKMTRDMKWDFVKAGNQIYLHNAEASKEGSSHVSVSGHGERCFK